jgi:hypothetical protein
MTNEECPFFFSCDAPLCPFYNFNGIWYADETICKNPKYSKLDVIKNQKKISRINKRHEVQGIFTFNMLNRPLKIYKSISGLNEDLDLEGIAKSENAWIQKHKGMSEETKLKLLSNLGKEKTEVRENEI